MQTAELWAELQQHGISPAKPWLPAPRKPPNLTRVAPGPVNAPAAAAGPAGTGASDPYTEASRRLLEARVRSNLGRSGYSRTIPAHEEPVGYTVQRDPGPSKETAVAIDEAMQKRAEADAAVAEAETKAASKEAARLAAEAQREQAQVDVEREKRAMIDAKLSSLMEEQDKAIGALNSHEINPDREWEQKGSGAKVMAAISMALAAFAGPEYLNQVRQIINKRVDDDISAQRAKLETLSDVARQRGTRLGQAISMYGSQEAGELAIRERQLKATQMQTQAIMAKTKSEDGKQRLAALVAALEEDRLRARAQLETATGASVTRQVRWVPEQTAGGGGPNVDQALKDLAALKELEGGGMQTEESRRDAVHRRVVLPGGKVAWAARNLDAKDQQTIINSTHTVVGYLGRLEELIREREGLTPGLSSRRREINREIGDLANSIQPELQKVNNTGASLTETEIAAIKPFVGRKLLEWKSLTRSTDAMARDIERAKQIINARHQGAINSLFADPWEPVPLQADETVGDVRSD